MGYEPLCIVRTSSVILSLPSVTVGTRCAPTGSWPSGGAIHSAAKSATACDDNARKGKAEALRKVIDERLCKTLILAGAPGRPDQEAG